MNISVVTLNWNSSERVTRFLQEFPRSNSQLRIEHVVVDNASNPKDLAALKASVDQLKGVCNIKLVCLTMHPGVTASLNIGFNNCNDNADIYARIDNDVSCSQSNLVAICEYCISSFCRSVGIVGPRIVYAKNPQILNSGAIYLDKIGRSNRNIDAAESVMCDCILGAAMFFNPKAVKSTTALFDESLYLFAEEPEVSWRLKKNYALSTEYYPHSTFLHDTKIGTGKHPILSSYLHYRNHEVVFSRIWGGKYKFFRFVNLFPRILLRCIKDRTMAPIEGYLDGLLGRPIDQKWWIRKISIKR